MSDRDPLAHPSITPHRDLADARLAALEHAVEQLTTEVATLRAELRQQAGAPAGGAAPRPSDEADAARARAALAERLRRAPAPTDRVPYDRRATLAQRINSADVEGFVGRYGTLVLATVTALAAVGTFLGWAIAHGLLGPRMRVVLGLVTATAVTVGGYRLRRRERSFGSTLMALGLAILHVCAWAAGPWLGLVPHWLALGATTIVSAALAWFAHGENDEALWCAGFGGAAVAPFVTAMGPGRAGALTAYGAAVLIGGAYALKGRAWRVAGRVFLATATLYTGALITLPERELSQFFALGLPLVVGFAGVLPFAERSLMRPWLRGLGVLAAAAAARAALATGLPLVHEQLMLVIVAGGVAWLVLADLARAAPRGPAGGGLFDLQSDAYAWLEGFWIPLTFVVMMAAALDRGSSANALVLALTVPVLLAALHRRGAGAERDALVAVAALCAVGAAVLWQQGHELAMLAAVAATAVLLLAMHGRWPSASWVVVAVAALVLASLGAVVQLTDRPAYGYVPFATRATATAAVVALAWIAMAWLAPRSAAALDRADAERQRDDPSGQRAAMRRRLAAQARVAPWLFAFVWVHQEIASAFSPSIATLLRVSYYAVTSVLCVGVGRLRERASLRHTGLALALLAAGTALYGAHGLSVIAARVGAYLVVSVFLLGIAYWYRGARAEASGSA